MFAERFGVFLIVRAVETHLMSALKDNDSQGALQDARQDASLADAAPLSPDVARPGEVSSPVASDAVPAPKSKPRPKRPRPTFEDGTLTKHFKFPSKTYPKSTYYMTADEVVIRIRKARKKWKLIVPKKRIVSYRTNRWFAKPRWVELELTFTQATRLGLIAPKARLKPEPQQDIASQADALEAEAELQLVEETGAEASRLDDAADFSIQADTDPEPVYDSSDDADDVTQDEPTQAVPAIDEATLDAEPLAAADTTIVSAPAALQPQAEVAVIAPVPPASRVETIQPPAKLSLAKLSLAKSPPAKSPPDRKLLLAAAIMLFCALTTGAWFFKTQPSSVLIAAAPELPKTVVTTAPEAVAPNVQVQETSVPPAQAIVTGSMPISVSAPVPVELQPEPPVPVPAAVAVAVAEPEVQPKHAVAPEPVRSAVAEDGGCRALEVVAKTADIHFDIASPRLEPAAIAQLDSLAQRLKACPQARLAIAGHTDSDGRPNRNDALSWRRAEAVHNHLAAIGVAPTQLSVFGFADQRPAVPNTNSSNKRANRRVELVVGGGP